MDVDFIWDEAKAESNLRKHGIAFEDAIAAVCDPGRLECFDSRVEYGEVRMQIIGMFAKGVMFVVVVVVEGIGT